MYDPCWSDAGLYNLVPPLPVDSLEHPFQLQLAGDCSHNVSQSLYSVPVSIGLHQRDGRLRVLLGGCVGDPACHCYTGHNQHRILLLVLQLQGGRGVEREQEQEVALDLVLYEEVARSAGTYRPQSANAEGQVVDNVP